MLGVAKTDDTEKPSLHRSEIVSRTCNVDGSVTLRLRDMTFDDLFREQFIPLDSRKKVGDYIIGKTIGEGSFSKVRLGKNIKTDDKVAIKVIPKKTILKRHDARRRFIRETRALQKLAHENIVRLFDVMETSGNYYLVMELIQGQTYKDFLHKRSRLDEEEARPLVHQMATAVNYMHTQGTVHRDLKPDNFLLQGDRVKIIDFGLSASLASGELLKTQCGSPAFAAPEVFNKQAYDRSADLWSLGVILYRSVTGSLPFVTSGRTYVHMYAVILRGYDPPRGVSPECKTLISQLLQVEPSARITSRDLCRHEWFAKGGHEAVT